MKLVCLVAALALSIAACSRDISGEQLAQALRQHPEVLLEAIKANGKAVSEIMNAMALEEQLRAQAASEAAESAAIEEAFVHPLVPAIDDKTRVRGARDASYTLVEYSDFQCPYCAAGNQTVAELRKKYGSKLRFVYKHLPLAIHEQALPAAQWFEAIAVQSPEKAWRFHDILFANQDKLGSSFFRKTARELGVELAQCERDVASAAVRERIAGDMEEAARFGFEGTPGFLLNGIPVKGANPPAYFEAIIDRLKAAKSIARRGT